VKKSGGLEKASVYWHAVAYAEALEYVREGDTLVVWRLDRLGRSLKHLIETISKLNNGKIGFKSITENIDTTTSGGKLVH